MSTALAPVEHGNAITQAGQFFSPAQESMILKTFLGGASKEEAAVLLEVVKRRRLDPFARQVYFVKRWDSQKREEVWAIQTSIDGLRSIADRTGAYEGQTAPQWCAQDGVWRDVWLDKNPPAAARVGVYKAKFREPVYGIARLDAYIQTKKDGAPTQFWARMADVMLAKCAEALALRKAFPEDTGGLYINEEMGQDAAPEQPAQQPAALPADPVVEVVQPPAEPQKPAPAKGLPPKVVRVKAIIADAKAKGIDTEAKFSALVQIALGKYVGNAQWTAEDMAFIEGILAAPEKVAEVLASDDIKF